MNEIKSSQSAFKTNSDSQMNEIKSSQSNFKTNSENSNLNKSDDLSRKLKVNNQDISYKNNLKSETYLSNNNNNNNNIKNNIDFESSLYSKNIIHYKLQKNEIIKKTY